MIARPLLFAAPLLLAACRAGAPEAPLELVLAGEPGARRVEARGLREVAEPEAGWPAVFSLRVASAHLAGGPPVVGRYALSEGTLVFEPRFELELDLEYVAVLRRALLAGAEGDEADLVCSLVVPRTAAPVAPVVEAVYPTARPLPANVLKFYVHFSQPMARGFAYRHAHVLEATGERVERPFLELGEELWNPDGTRLTLLLDPGRIKRGLLLHEQMGPVLEPDRSYALAIDAGWPSADGAELARDVRLDFATTAADPDQPDPRRWSLEPPRAASREALVLTLDEPLDHALLQHSIRVVAADGRTLAGDVTTGAGETRWSFAPRAPWDPGAHTLTIALELEDLAGNSVGRPFETRLTTPAPAAAAEPVRIPFRPTPR